MVRSGGGEGGGEETCLLWSSLWPFDAHFLFSLLVCRLRWSGRGGGWVGGWGSFICGGIAVKIVMAAEPIKAIIMVALVAVLMRKKYYA